MRERNSFVLGALALATVSMCLASAVMAQSQPVLKSIVQFDGTNGSDATSDLIQLPNGNFLGVTLKPPNMPKAQSTIYELKADGTIQVLYRLAADGSQGTVLSNVLPENGLLQASDGNIYGVMNQGGPLGQGLLYRFTLPGKFEVLHNFDIADGANPVGKLVQALDGNLYGVTSYGGAYGFGEIFRLGLDGNFGVVYSFSGTDQIGNTPLAGLASHPAGMLYGTLQESLSGGGTVYQFNPATGEVKLVSPGPVFATTPPVVGSDGGLYFLAGPPSSCSECSGSLVRYGIDGGGPEIEYAFLATQVAAAVSLMQAGDGSFVGGCWSAVAVVSVCQINTLTQRLTLTKAPIATGIPVVGNFVEGAHGNLLAALPKAGKSPGFGAVIGLLPALPKPAPGILGFYPASVSAGDTVTLLGNYFIGATEVSINGHGVTFTVKGSGAVQFVVPPDATSGQVSISNQGGSAVSSTSLNIR